MATEIERKFLVRDRSVLSGLAGTHIGQGYLADNGMTVRVRVAGDKGFLTLKSNTQGLSRAEFEYPIPLSDAEDLLNGHASLGRLTKVRYLIPVRDVTFEVDVFEGELDGLVVAEVELGSEEQDFPRPAWLGDEVSHDPRYRNSELAVSRRVPA
ncbi:MULTISPECIES: CYTH domain-containing protein [unclassified Variovorax]|uniref:CYTH domain-containing protein n=1 Tax=unclassified Variovorax TaxID=663243 RepID=UPI000838BFEC|nr:MULTISPECIES: CYTH domain-containing protein [unclassified Variovorax]PNG50148.1 Inorganic triphosphatase [Variovorax sp. B2]PNG51021.1 Inorganic triphosphatase [Variovorax sp. B4]VTU42079.1 CYTH domain protein [Variovorax sp. SRS16]VTU42114.1 CYTH domain protein [Variovorax sp. PBL-E5]VTU44380.1 CYTH domain protein [Variovorax sp. PBL-H6]